MPRATPREGAALALEALQRFIKAEPHIRPHPDERDVRAVVTLVRQVMKAIREHRPDIAKDAAKSVAGLLEWLVDIYGGPDLPALGSLVEMARRLREEVAS